jgi:hypothetical protein
MTEVEYTVEDRLNEQIYQLEGRVAELTEENENLRYSDDWRWRMAKPLTEEENLGLPLPRLEVRYDIKDSYSAIVTHQLVLKHFLGTIECYPIESTKMNGRMEGTEKDLRLPFRMGVHFQHDMRQTGLPGFVVCGTASRQVDPNSRDE